MLIRKMLRAVTALVILFLSFTDRVEAQVSVFPGREGGGTPKPWWMILVVAIIMFGIFLIIAKLFFRKK